jgi:hypothetical protein
MGHTRSADVVTDEKNVQPHVIAARKSGAIPERMCAAGT